VFVCDELSEWWCLCVSLGGAAGRRQPAPAGNDQQTARYDDVSDGETGGRASKQDSIGWHTPGETQCTERLRRDQTRTHVSCSHWYVVNQELCVTETILIHNKDKLTCCWHKSVSLHSSSKHSQWNYESHSVLLASSAPIVATVVDINCQLAPRHCWPKWWYILTAYYSCLTDVSHHIMHGIHHIGRHICHPEGEFTLLLIHLILDTSFHHSPCLHCHNLSVPRPFMPDLKLICHEASSTKL